MKPSRILLVVPLVAIACGSDPEPVTEAASATPPTTSGENEKKPEKDPQACPYDGDPIDVAEFTPCLDGGRCVPEAVIPENERARLAKCPDGYCVPEKILKNAGKLLPKSCTSIGAGEGRCMSTVFPDIEKDKDSLPVDVCDANERCVPCFDPISGDDTGACSSVSCDAPKLPKTVFGSCCKAQGRCVPKTMIPADEHGDLAVHECKDGAELCVPSETMAPTWVPGPCTASGLTGSYAGVCISTCIPRDFLGQLGTSQGSCDANHFCAPCKNPLTQAPTGAPGCAP
jgi:hypothetical protein